MSQSVAEYPFVSVIMPIRNEAGFIRAAIQSVLSNDYPHERMEVLVVDGMSDDGTREIVSQMAASDSRVRLIDNVQKIVPPAMNIGLREMKGEMFTRLDGHAEMMPDFIKNSVHCLLSKDGAWVVGGAIETVCESYVGKAIALVMSSPFGVGGAKFRTGNYEGWVDTLAFGMHYSWIIEKVGYFDESFIRAQDTDFNTRIIKAGGKIWLSQDIKSIYYGRASLNKLRKQYLQYGFWRVRFIQKHGRASALRQYVPACFVASLVLLTLLAVFFNWGRVLLLFLIGFYSIFLMFSVVDITVKSKLKYGLFAPIVIPVIHFCFAIGNIKGVWNFFFLRRHDIDSNAYSMTR